MKILIKVCASALILLCGLQSATAQSRIPVDLKQVRVSIGLLEPSVLAEFKIGEKQSFVTTGGITFGAASDNLYVFPFLRGSLRHYYDRKRVKKSNLRTNSGNFVTLQGGYYFGALSDVTTTLDQYYFFGPAWGLQRNYNSGIHLSFSLGLGYGNGQNTTGDVASTGHFTFGFTFK